MSDYVELEAVEELEPISANMASIEDDSHLIKLEDSGMLKSLTKNFEQSLIPMILLNSRQKIIFCNTTFSQDIVRQAEVRGLSLFQIVDPFDNAEKALNIQQALRLGETGFSWRGQIRFSHKKFLNTETNALISPIFPEDSGQDPPVGHLCLFDNVTEDNRAIIHKTFQSLLEASKMKDNDTGSHIQRVGSYSRIMAQWLFDHHVYPQIDAQFIENIAFLAPMHDVGKIGTPDAILHKTGRLEAGEWDIMREHTINGGFILSSYPNPMATQIAISHHEWWDGTGYPYKLNGDTIPLPARIVAVADVYDALRMKRSYKEAFTHEDACGIIKKDGGSHFDPAIVEVFFKLDREIENTFNTLADEG